MWGIVNTRPQQAQTDPDPGSQMDQSDRSAASVFQAQLVYHEAKASKLDNLLQWNGLIRQLGSSSVSVDG